MSLTGETPNVRVGASVGSNSLEQFFEDITK